MTVIVQGPGGAVKIEDGTDPSRLARVTPAGRVAVDVESITVTADSINLDTADLEAAIALVEDDVEAVVTSLGTEGAAPPSIPGTGVRGWLRSIYDRLTAGLGRTWTLSSGTDSVSVVGPLTDAQLRASAVPTSDATAQASLASLLAQLDVALSTRAQQTTLQLVYDKLVDVLSAINNLTVETQSLVIDADTINLSTDQVESLLQSIRDRLPALLDVDGGVKAHIQNFPADQLVHAANLDIALSALRDAIRGTSSNTLTDIATALAATLTVAGTVTANQGAAGSAQWKVKDDYDLFESLADQLGADGVLTFTFAAPVDLVWIRSVGGISRADPAGGTPTATSGLFCADDEPTPVTFHTSSVKVYAPTGSTVSVWGYGRV